MSPTAIILLIGVCSFWAGFGVFVMLFLRMRKTLGVLEETLRSVDAELQALSPAISGTMRQLERTGRNVDKTASEVETLVHGVNTRAISPAVAGVASYLPLALSVYKMLKPVFSHRRNR